VAQPLKLNFPTAGGRAFEFPGGPSFVRSGGQRAGGPAFEVEFSDGGRVAQAGG